LGLVGRLKALAKAAVLGLMVKEVKGDEGLHSARQDLFARRGACSTSKDLSELLLIEGGLRDEDVKDVLLRGNLGFVGHG
jgi:hypothetical protein